MAQLAADITSFVVNFREPISKSTPHIYLSALPFSPKNSKLSESFLHQYPHTLSVFAGQEVYWPAVLNILEEHTGFVWSVAFSPDGKYVVSGSYDKTIRVWDAKTGITVSGPFEGHTDSVFSVAFSPDGKYVVSGSADRMIRVWDAETGNTVSGPFEGHTDSVWSVAFSPDGKYVVSGSYDKTIRIWDAEKGNTVSWPFEGHTDCVWSVAFSPDGKYVVSGSYDKTIRVWDAKKDNTVSGPSKGHTGSVKEKVLSQISDDGHISTWGDGLALSDDGWVHNINFGLLFWIPLQNRRGLVWPRTRAIMGVAATVLDFSQFVHGSCWEKCLHKGTRSDTGVMSI